MAKNRRKQKKEFEISNSHLISFGLIGFGVIYLLSLISFSLNDLQLGCLLATLQIQQDQQLTLLALQVLLGGHFILHVWHYELLNSGHVNLARIQKIIQIGKSIKI